jgi:antitoxin YefM
MRRTSLGEFGRTLVRMLDRLTGEHEPVSITRGVGHPEAIPLSTEDSQSDGETGYLLRSPRNADRLLSAVDDLDRARRSR